jgi:two-component sensor histidine kinase/PAS domain-containing protein
LALIAAAVVPVWLFAGFVLVSFAISQQQTYRDQAIDLARQSAAIVDGELRDMLVRLDGLARSVAFEEGDMAKAHAEARRLVAGTDQTILLRNLSQRQFFNTEVQFGSPMPPAATLTTEEVSVFQAGQPRVSDVKVDPGSTEPYVAVTRPLVLRDGSSALLSIATSTLALNRVLTPTVPAGWVVGVGDRSGVYVTRSARHEEVSGKPGVTEYISEAVGRFGSFTSANQFGEKLLAGYQRSEFSDWLFAANISLATVEAPLWRSLFGVVGIGAVALAISLLLAFLMGKTFTGEAKKLAAQALAIGSGHAVQPLETRFVEFEQVSDAFVDADAMIRERTSELEAVLDTVPVAVWFTYDPAGRQVIRNRYAVELMKLPTDQKRPFGLPDEVIDTVALKDGQPVSRDDRPLTKAMRGEQTDHEEFLYRLPDGTELILSSSARPIHDDKGKLIGAVQISMDVTDRKRAETQRRLMAKELDHRVKNNLAIVQALVQQTLRNADNLDDAQTDVVARLAALANAHDILTKNAWLEGDLQTTIEATVLAQASSDRVTIEGPQVSLAPTQVMAISLAMHELTTNAVKYGALSNESGQVTISWHVAAPDKRRQLEVIWTERGGPPVVPPTRRGFGSRLLERMTASEGGSATRAFEPEGLTCTLRLPLEPAN